MTAFSKTSLRTLLGAAALASLVSALAAPASAALIENGAEVNGVEINGLADNGTQLNALTDNGIHDNGVEHNALSDNGVALKGTSAVTRRDGAFDFESVTLIDVTPPSPAVR